MKVLITVTLILNSFFINAQDEECYTQWEVQLQHEINEYRQSKGLPPFTYSPIITSAANLQCHDKTKYISLFNLYQYQGYGVPMMCSFKFDYETPKSALELILMIDANKAYLEDKSTRIYKTIGVARIENSVVVYLGTTNEEEVEIPNCITESIATPSGYKWLFEPKSEFWDIAPYHIGNYIAVRDINRWGVCDLQGNMKMDFTYFFLAPYDTASFIAGDIDLAVKSKVVDVNKNVLWEYTNDGYIYLGYANVRIGYKNHLNYLETNEGEILSDYYEDMIGMTDGVIAFMKNGVYGFMDYAGKVLVTPQYADIFSFSEGKACVKKNGKWSFIDKQFKTVVPPFSSERKEFYYGQNRVAVKIGGKCGYLDETGKMIINNIYDVAENFNTTGLAPVAINGKYGFIDSNGKIIIPLEYDQAMQFNFNYGAIKKGKYYAIVDVEGNILTPFEFDDLIMNDDNIIKVKKSGRWGMIEMLPSKN